MNLSYQKIEFPEAEHFLVSFLTSEEWPFHVNNNLSTEKIKSMISKGDFTGSNNSCFWILGNENEKIGIIRLFDLDDVDDVDDGYPLFDLRVLKKSRGLGVGKQAVRWLTEYLFNKYKSLGSIVGTTRMDNVAMKRIFTECLYVKEGHFREDWECMSGKNYDTIRFSILRKDWESGTVTPVNWSEE